MVSQYIAALLAAKSLPAEIACHRVMPAEAPIFGKNMRPWPKAINDLLARQGISNLYNHQNKATDLVRAGRHVLAATPTASGKSLIYNLPVLERCLANPDTKALYLFPLKALAQDQLAAFNRLTEHWPEQARPKAAIYDGDTSSYFRQKIRKNLPNVLLTNPEMLHLSLLPFHENWAEFWAGLDFVVIDEVHTYRGLLGSHMAQLFLRMQRVAGHYGSSPSFIMCSATIGNPGELAQNLTGLGERTGETAEAGEKGEKGETAETGEIGKAAQAGKTCQIITESGAPKGKRNFVFLNPEGSPARTAILLLQSALARNLRTIVYCQSRRMTELISLWAKEKAGPYKNKISAYRAGFLPEERREIESRMEQGDLLAVISTSALELGIDIGGLDLCILVGYPGTVMSFLQRGGRVGRQGQESAVLFVAQEDALDQYFIRNPNNFFSRPPEQAVLNPHNPVIMARHLPCAAAELPIKQNEAWFGPAPREQAEKLVQKGELLRSACGQILYSARKRPQRHVDLRGAGSTHIIVDDQGNNIGSIDGMRAWHETHPGAIYIHRGKTYQIERINEATQTIYALPAKTSYYTRVRSNKETLILEVLDQKMLSGGPMYFGRLRVTEQITGYERRCTRSGKLLGITALNAPDFVFETQGLWFSINEELQQKTEDALIHFMGSIHALEHAGIGILPLLVMCDRNDLGGISTPMHPQVGRPCVFIYDGMPGGAGLTQAAFAKGQELMDNTYKVIAECACELGCPSCVHSPKCGSGNRPIDKMGALFLARHLTTELSGQISGHPNKHLGGQENLALAHTCSNMPLSPHENLMQQINSTGASYFESCAALPGGNEMNLDQMQLLENINKNSQQDKDFARQEGDFSEQPNNLNGHNEGLGSPQTNSQPGFLDANPTNAPKTQHYLVLDVETQLSADEVGGWHRADKMRVSVAVVYNSQSDEFISFNEEEMPALLSLMASGPLVVGFNLKRFDYSVLSLYVPKGMGGKDFFKTIPTLDMLEEVQSRLGYRVSLDNLAQATLNAAKSADGLDALRWWKQGEVEKIRLYCESDVRLTRDIYLHGREHGFLLFTNKAKNKVQVPATWKA